MNIKIHTAILLVGCTLTGLGIGLSLVLGYRSIESESHELGPNSVAMKDVSRLEQLMGQWLLSADLVLNGETYMLKSSGRQAHELRELIAELRTSPLAADNLDDLVEMDYGVRRVQEIVDDTDRLGGADRAQRLAELVARSDDISGPLVPLLARFAQRMGTRSHHHVENLERRKASLQTMSMFGVVVYLLVVGGAWSWTVRTMVRPIEDLSLAAERSHLNERDAFALEEQGPDEVRRLTRNVSAFIDKMHTAREHTEQEVRDRTAQLVKANKAKGEFLATMSHELRTPLNGIINMNELILDTELDRNQRQCAETAKTAAEALLGLINDILDFSKIEAKKLELESTPFQLHEVVEGAIEIVSGVAESKSIALAAIVEHGVPPAVIGDPTRLRQILMNLLNNALKFTERGQVVVRVTQEVCTEEAAVLRFEITDTGIGIPPDRINALFQAFQQADSSTTRRFGGTGLGLAICKELTELMGGEIGVHSEVAQGSTFWFTIAIALPAAEAAALAAPRAHQRVLVVSRRELVHAQLVAYLRTLGFEPDAICAVATPNERPLGDFLAGASRVFVLVDPFRCDDAAWTALGNLPTQGAPAVHTCVLEHLLRRRNGAEWRAPAGVPTLAEPLRLAQLRTWLDTAHIGIVAPNPRADGEDAAERLSGVILVAEDNPINQRVALKILERTGLRVVTVEHGGLAVDYVQTHQVDLVLMDCQMPVMDGLHATRLIRQLERENKLARKDQGRLPIIACTANALDGERGNCLDVGMDDYLTKPFKPAQLVAVVRQGLRADQRRVTST